MPYLLVMIGSALGGLLRYAISRWTLSWNPTAASFPYGTVLINILGSFLIGYFGTLTLQTGKYPASDNTRLFVMVGVCGGFTTFSSFSLQTFEMLRAGFWGRAMLHASLSVLLCVAAVSLGHSLAHRAVPQQAISETAEEEFTG